MTEPASQQANSSGDRWQWIAVVGVPIAGIVLIVVGMFGAVFAWGYGEWRSSIDRGHNEQEKAEAARTQAEAELADVPKLRYLSSRYAKNGDSIITLDPTSKTRFANIVEVKFVITDDAMLDQIRRVDPQPPDMGIGAQNHVDDVFFQKGTWMGNSYQFTARTGINVPPGAATDLQLAIINPKYGGMQLKGELEILFSDGREGIVVFWSKPEVWIKARAK